MAKKPENFKCLKCRKIVYKNQNSICCDKCDQWIHLKCSKMRLKEFKKFLDPENSGMKYFCSFCTDYPCGKCEKPIYDDSNSLQCESECGKWFHLRCTCVSLSEYKIFLNNPETSLPWFCFACYKPPFHDLTDTEMSNLICTNDFEKLTIKELAKHCYNTTCSVCRRKINKDKVQKALICKNCQSLIHRRCSGISNYELNSKNPNKLLNWECTNCYSEKFAFNGITDIDLVKDSFNSNFECPCQNVCTDTQYRKNLLLELAKYQNEEKYGPDPFNHIDKCFNLNIEFDYYTLHNFHKLVKKLDGNRKKYFSIYHTNIESLQCNFERLHTQLSHLDHSFDIIALSEVWNPLYKAENFRADKLDGYKKYIGMPGYSLKSGCGLYIKNTLRTIERHDLDISYHDDNNEFQGKWIEIINDKTVNIILGVIYRHPRKKSDKIFNEMLKKNLNSIKRENKQLFIIGDMNYDLLKINVDKDVSTFFDILSNSFLQPCILEPTRIVHGNKPSIVDNIFTNAITKTIKSGNLLCKLSDHMPNFSFIVDIKITKKKEKRFFRNFKNFNEIKYRDDLAHIDITDFLTSSNVNEIYDAYHEKLLKVINMHAPLKKLSRKEIKWRTKPWITTGIQKSIKEKNSCYKKYVKTRHKFWHDRCKYCTKMIKNLIFSSKKKYYEKYFAGNSKNSKKIWKGINEILKNRTKSDTDIYIDENGTMITDKKKWLMLLIFILQILQKKQLTKLKIQPQNTKIT